jgi:hypothetical protein
MSAENDDADPQYKATGRPGGDDLEDTYYEELAQYHSVIHNNRFCLLKLL